MTISFDQAKALVEERVGALGAANGHEFVITHDETIDEGWIFFYNSKEFVETGNLSSALVGNGPIFVNRNGRVTSLPSGVPWEVAIRGGV